MGAEGLHDDRIDDEPRQDRPVGVRADHRFVDEVLDDDDHPIRGERRLLLAPEQPPHLGIARGVGALGVDDRHIGLQGRDRIDGSVAIGRRDRPDEGIRRRQVGLEIAPQRVERQVRRARRVPPDHPEVAVLLDLERRRIGGLDPPPDCP